MLLKNNPINPAATLDTLSKAKCKSQNAIAKVAGLVLGGQRYENNSKLKTQNAKMFNIVVSHLVESR